jgi:hypothetical protein
LLEEVRQNEQRETKAQAWKRELGKRDQAIDSWWESRLHEEALGLRGRGRKLLVWNVNGPNSKHRSKLGLIPSHFLDEVIRLRSLEQNLNCRLDKVTNDCIDSHIPTISDSRRVKQGGEKDRVCE